MRSRIVASITTALCLITACGGNDGPTGPVGSQLTNGTAGMLFDGQAFNPVAAAFNANETGFALSMGDGLGRGFALVMSTNGPGTYTIAMTPGNNAVFVHGSATWQTANLGPGAITGSGTLVLTTLTANRATGSFSFTLHPTAGSGATGIRSISSGSFDLTK